MLKERIRFFAKDVLYYGLGNMLYSIAQFISMPIVVKNMDKAQVANWNILLPTGILLAAIITFGMDSAVVRFVKDAKTEKEKKTIFSSGIFFSVFLACLVVTVMCLFPGQLQSSIQISPGNTNSWFILTAWVPSIIIAQFFQNWFKYTFRRSLFLTLIIIQSVVYFGSVVYMKMTDQVSLYNVMLAMLASQGMVAVIGFVFCRKMFVLNIKRKLLINLIIYGVPFMILAFGFNLIASIDRYILPGRLNEEDFAVYSQAFRITAIISMLVSSFNFAFNPFLLSILGQDQVPETLGRFHTYYLMFMCFIGLCFIALSKIIIIILAGVDYVAGRQYMVFFILGYIFYGLFSIAQAGIIHSKKSYLALYAIFLGLVMVLIFDFILVTTFAGYGTAAGFMGANIVMVILANVFSAKYIPVRYSLVKDGIMIGALFGGGLLLSWFDFSKNIITDAALKLVVVMVGGGLLFFSLLTASDKTYLRNFLAGKKFKGLPDEKSSNLY